MTAIASNRAGDHRCRGAGLAAACLAVLALAPSAALARAPLAFEITYAPEFHPGPISARVYVMLGQADAQREPRFGPNWFDPQPLFAADARDWKPGEPLRIGPEADAFPVPLAELKAGNYQAQAVVRLNLDTHKIGNGEGNGFGPAVRITLDPEKGGPVPLVIARRVAPRQFPETDRLKLVEIPSPLLSAFYHRPVRQRAAVILPEAGLKEPRPTLYIVPGFGGDHTMAVGLARAGAGPFGFARDLVRVVLDPDCYTGHHVFADSATNGPRGKALVQELIPHIEKQFPCIPQSQARLLNGHSSGGWSTLWLQVTYPDFFGGTWSTSPDPVDFRDFQRINLYAPGENMFRDRQGNRRPLARRGESVIIWYDDFSRLEDAIGDGGQLRSFECCFSPLGPDGKARRVWDRASGAIDTSAAKDWEPYDIRLVLERGWKTLGPKLAGKLHVITGDLDTFYLEGAVKLLKESLQKLQSDAVVEIVPGRDHGSLLDAALAERIDREMKAAVARFLPASPAPAAATP